MRPREEANHQGRMVHSPEATVTMTKMGKVGGSILLSLYIYPLLLHQCVWRPEISDVLASTGPARMAVTTRGTGSLKGYSGRCESVRNQNTRAGRCVVIGG